MREHFDLSLIFDIIGVFLFVLSIYLSLQRIQLYLGSLDKQVKGLQLGHKSEPLYGTVSPIIKALINNRNHIYASSGFVLSHVFNRYIRDLAATLSRVTEVTTVDAVIPDVSPVCEFLGNLAETIPRGSVYFGISLLTAQQAWEGDERSCSTRVRDGLPA